MSALRPYQVDALEWLLIHGRGIYADPPGAGKTATTLRWLEEMGGGVQMIVAPLSVLGHWQREAALWYPELQIVNGAGTPKQRALARETVQEAGRSDGGAVPSALLLHYEAVRQDIEALCGIEWDSIVFDEAHRLKGRNTLISKAAIRLARRCDHLALLTGTPIMNRAEELWSLLRLLDPAEYRSFWRWTERYFITEQAHWIKSPRPVTLVKGVKPEALDDLRAEVKPHVLQRPLSALLPDLPEVEHVMYPVALSGPERRIYDALEKHCWVQAEDGSILQVSNEVSKIARQRQLSSDFSSLFDGGAPASKAKAAIELVRELVEQGEKVVVMAAYRHTAHAISEALEAVLYYGEMNAEQRECALGDFMSNSQVLVGTQATLGEGVDGLQCARHLVMVDRDWTPARNEQAVGRLHRSGQTDTVFVWHVYAENTIDETVARTCEDKQRIIEEVLG